MLYSLPQDLHFIDGPRIASFQALEKMSQTPTQTQTQREKEQREKDRRRDRDRERDREREREAKIAREVAHRETKESRRAQREKAHKCPVVGCTKVR